MVSVALALQPGLGLATTQDNDQPVAGYSACRAGSTVTRPFRIADGIQRRDLHRLVKHWNQNNNVDDASGRCTAPSTLEQIESYVSNLVATGNYSRVDHKPDWATITFGRVSGRGSRPARSGDDAPGVSSPGVKAPAVKGEATPNYIEVSESGGIIRLSPEVIARNEAAAADYKRKMEEHSRTVARIEAEKQAAAAKRAEILAKAAERQAEYERALAKHAADVADQKAAVEGPSR